ncbi:hypothetical protein HHK36_028482 [Tetracentron sinense]|uniref:RRM domain-containing protein n=1 Tax=Tetracentron sinense TaxID=13715 RepID=A0A834YF40_TETSI|nr:hypothetical protein HHK36_028482 [Tetracentron sinense]
MEALNESPKVLHFAKKNIHLASIATGNSGSSFVSKEWDIQRPSLVLPPEIVESIVRIQCNKTGGENSRVWHFEKNGIFSVRSRYHSIKALRLAGRIAKPSASAVWDQKGSILGGFTRALRGGSPVVAEAAAVWQAIDWARYEGWKKVVILSDARGLVESIYDHAAAVHWEVRVVVEHIRVVLRQEPEFFVLSTPRAANAYAHRLAAFGQGLGGSFRDFSLLPARCRRILASRVCAIPPVKRLKAHFKSDPSCEEAKSNISKVIPPVKWLKAHFKSDPSCEEAKSNISKAIPPVKRLKAHFKSDPSCEEAKSNISKAIPPVKRLKAHFKSDPSCEEAKSNTSKSIPPVKSLKLNIFIRIFELNACCSNEMGKKSKDKEKNEKSCGVDGSSDIFKTIFGEIPEEVSASLFSNNNPFRRKPDDQPKTPHQLGLGFSDDKSGENPKNGDSDNHSDPRNHPIDLNEVKKRKRDKERKPYLDSDSIEKGSENLVEAKKAKRKNPNLDVELIGKGKDNLDAFVGMERDDEENEDPNKGKKKKKRKRDEIEKEYEAKNYGVVAEIEGKGAGLGRKVAGEKRKTVDDPAEMLVSKEGFDDESKLLRTVFVGNLPLKVKKKALLKEFGRFGEVESVRIRSVPILDSKIPRKGAIFKGKINDSVDNVHAYIVFKDEQSAQASLTHNMAVVAGNHVRVDMACPPRKKLKGEDTPLYDSKRTVFVGNLPFDVKDEELYQLFCGIKQLESAIEAVRVIRDPHSSVGKGIAYVLFKSRDAANLVVKKRNLKLRDRDLRLSHVKSDIMPSKKRNPSFARTDNSPSKRLAVGSNGTPSVGNKAKVKTTLSYQGLRASKSGVQKKVVSRPKTGEPGKLKSMMDKGTKLKKRQSKRPAVLARKANALKGGEAPRQPEKKRKLESRTPESSHRNKKARKLS